MPVDWTPSRSLSHPCARSLVCRLLTSAEFLPSLKLYSRGVACAAGDHLQRTRWNKQLSRRLPTASRLATIHAACGLRPASSPESPWAWNPSPDRRHRDRPPASTKHHGNKLPWSPRKLVGTKSRPQASSAGAAPLRPILPQFNHRRAEKFP